MRILSDDKNLRQYCLFALLDHDGFPLFVQVIIRPGYVERRLNADLLLINKVREMLLAALPKCLGFFRRINGSHADLKLLTLR